ncbi:acyl-CoA dehydrogenase family protein [Calderihabitans maritimus]|uniref:Acyl-CoA dehydrogenase n=1 Tax=Calderihabitans maritimus TaxID=1246530 RepID=A0A1Z5HWM9_9FIRM|nr:acyl-CoA dehydrogenase family protein [Calderihabitans maritimus]GAW93939.1 hypothetical protein KKC1_30600 [Calderihabitans maritimus]
MRRLSSQNEMLRQMVRRLAEEKVKPQAAEIDKQDIYPWDWWELFARQGLVGLSVPSQYGGEGNLISFCLTVEELSRVSGTAGLMINSQQLALTPLLLFGTREQKEMFLRPMASGQAIGGFALTEPEAGSDAGAIQTRAIRRGDQYIINGQKCLITNGGLAQYYIVFASTDLASGIRGITAFVVEADTPGLVVGRVEDKMGVRGLPTAELFFENCRVPCFHRIGQEGDGFKIAMTSLDRVRPGIGAQAVGIAQGAFEYALDYVKRRKQFNQPLATLQGIQFILADMVTQIEAARQLVYTAAEILEEALQQRNLSKEAIRYSSMAKLFASDVGMRVTTDAVQLLGGYGYLREHPVERMMRDAKIIQIYGGTNQIQKMIIARSVL